MKGPSSTRWPEQDEEKFAGVRAFYTYMLTHPGKKLLMRAASSASGTCGTMCPLWTGTCCGWRGRTESATGPLRRSSGGQRLSTGPPGAVGAGLSWEALSDRGRRQPANTIAFLVKVKKGSTLVTVCNFSPVDRTGYTIGVPTAVPIPACHSATPPSADGPGRCRGRSRAIYRVPRPGAGHHRPLPPIAPPSTSAPQVPVPPEKNRRSRAQGCKVRQGSQGGPQKDHPQVQGILTLFPVKR